MPSTTSTSARPETKPCGTRWAIALGVREIVVRTRITKVGRSSVRFEQTIVTPEGELAAEAEAVLVAWDPETRRSREITQEERQRLTAR